MTSVNGKSPFPSLQYGSIASASIDEKSIPALNDSGSSNNSTVDSTDSESSFLIPISREVPTSQSCHEQFGYFSSTSKNASFTPRRKHHERNSAAADLRLSMLSNFSTAYNVLSISLALNILSRQHSELTVADDSLCSSALFAGMIVGQLGGGALGDLLGRHMAMTVVMVLQVLASLLSSLSTGMHLNVYNSEEEFSVSIFHVLAFWRFILGLGCGGVYPLAATLTVESSSDRSTHAESEKKKAERVALAFSFQGVGYLTVPAVAWVSVSVFGDLSDLAWRLLLGFGALPGILLTISRVGHNVQHNSVPKAPAMADLTSQAQRAPSILVAIREEPQLFRKLLGTGGCWLLFDILFYGNTLFQPIVLACAFGSEEETVTKAARDSALIACLALPGYFVSVRMVGRQTPRYIQLQGFALMAVLYAFIGTFFDQMKSNRYLLLGVYGSTFFFSNYGPNATTFMLPAMTFSKHCRSTLNGFCAACGKVGALIGSIVFARALQHYGQSVVFWCCAVLSLAGYIVTLVCVKPTSREESLIMTASRDNEEPKSEPARIPSVYSMPSLFDFHD